MNREHQTEVETSERPTVRAGDEPTVRRTGPTHVDAATAATLHDGDAAATAVTRLGGPTLVTQSDASTSSGDDLLLGRYRLKKRLGSGAFGTVWSARDERLERDVAVKVLPRERVVQARFEREARAAARLQHPAIVTLYEAAVDDDGAYLVSELVRGKTLDQLLEQGKLSDREIVEIGAALCQALDHAHAEGVIHRDVKPSNVLVAIKAGHPIAKLTDFGVAHVAGGDTLTRTGDVIGTLAYMAPEQADGDEVSPACDLYALAVVLYEALTGVNPLTGRRGRGRTGTYLPPLRRQRRDLSRTLAAGIDQALRPRPSEQGHARRAARGAVEHGPGGRRHARHRDRRGSWRDPRRRARGRLRRPPALDRPLA